MMMMSDGAEDKDTNVIAAGYTDNPPGGGSRGSGSVNGDGGVLVDDEAHRGEIWEDDDDDDDGYYDYNREEELYSEESGAMIKSSTSITRDGDEEWAPINGGGGGGDRGRRRQNSNRQRLVDAVRTQRSSSRCWDWLGHFCLWMILTYVMTATLLVVEYHWKERQQHQHHDHYNSNNNSGVDFSSPSPEDEIGDDYYLSSPAAEVPLVLQQSPLGQAVFSTARRPESGAALPKTIRSDRVRFVFLAGIMGAGHESWHDVLLWSNDTTTLCSEPPPLPNFQYREDASTTAAVLELLLYEVMLGPVERRDIVADEMVELMKLIQVAVLEQRAAMNGDDASPTLICLNPIVLPKPQTEDDEQSHFYHDRTWLTYPHAGRKTGIYHPNSYLLAWIAEHAGVDLRVVVLTRHPAATLVAAQQATTLTPNPFYDSYEWGGHWQANNMQVLNLQLLGIDREFYHCTALEYTAAQAADLAYFLLGGRGEDGNSATTTTVRRRRDLQQRMEMTFAPYAAQADNYDSHTWDQVNAMEYLLLHSAVKTIGGVDNGSLTTNRTLTFDILLQELIMNHDYLQQTICAGRW